MQPTEPSRLTWAQRLKRAFEFDVTICPLCGGNLRVIADITDPAIIDKILSLPPVTVCQSNGSCVTISSVGTAAATIAGAEAEALYRCSGSGFGSIFSRLSGTSAVSGGLLAALPRTSFSPV